MRSGSRRAGPAPRLPLPVVPPLGAARRGNLTMSLGTHVRLCLKDLYSQDVVEMIERETRKYEVEAIEHPDHPDFQEAFQLLWDQFGESGEMERESVIREMMAEDSTVPMQPSGSYARFFL